MSKELLTPQEFIAQVEGREHKVTQGELSAVLQGISQSAAMSNAQLKLRMNMLENSLSFVFEKMGWTMEELLKWAETKKDEQDAETKAVASAEGNGKTA